MMQVLQSLSPGYLGYYLSPHVMTLQLISDDMFKLTVAIFKCWWKKDISQQMMMLELIFPTGQTNVFCSVMYGARPMSFLSFFSRRMGGLKICVSDEEGMDVLVTYCQ